MEGRKKIYFLYTQFGKENNIKEFYINQKIKKAQELDKSKLEEYIRIFYSIDIPLNQNEDQIEISLKDKKGEFYYSQITLNTLELLGEENIETDEFIIFDLKFMDNEKDENNLQQFILSPDEQFYFFEKKFHNNDERLINLYSSAIAQILLKTNQNFNFILYIFFKLFDEKKYNDIPRFKEVLKYFFRNIDKILMKAEYIPTLTMENDKLDILSNTDNIRTKLIKLTGVKDTNIDLFLSYYYIYYKKNLFVKFINDNKYKVSLKNTLITHRKIFGNLTSEVINSDLIIEAKNIPEIVSLMELYPNIVECFKIVTDLLIYNKLAYFISNNRVGINPILLFKPNIKDDIYLIKKYFDETIEIYNMEKVYPLIIKEKFFLEYYKCFEKEDEDFNKNLIIIEMLDLYISKIPNKINTTEILNMHYKKGISLLKNNKLKNESFIKFIQSFRNIKDKEEIIKYFPNAIEFNENNKDNKDFITNILNEDSYDLKDFLGYKYDEVFNKIFDKFVLPKDLTCIRYWELDTNTPENIIYIAMKTIKRVWINNPENHMYGMDVLFTSIFSRASLCIDNYMDIILDLEKKISAEKLMIIYSNILIKNCEVNYQFKEHMINFILKNENETALYLWFLLSTYIDRNRRIELLKNNLKINFAVKYDDFIDYPKKLNDRINLFTKLKKNKFIPGEFADSEYYKYSMDSKNYLEKNIFKNALIIDNNINKIYELLINFFADNDEDASQIGIKITIFRDKVEIANRYYDSLKIIQKFWNTFFQDAYKDKLKDIKEQIEEFEKTDLEKAAEAKYLNKDILAKAEEGKKFIDSIFFMEIYNRLKKEIKDELELYKKSVENFKMLEKLGENNDLDLLDDDLKRDINFNLF